MRVKIAWTQSSIQVPGLVGSESTLSPEKCKNLISMDYKPEGLILHLKGGHTAIIPHANVKIAILEPEEKKAAKPKLAAPGH